MGKKGHLDQHCKYSVEYFQIVWRLGFLDYAENNSWLPNSVYLSCLQTFLFFGFFLFYNCHILNKLKSTNGSFTFFIKVFCLGKLIIIVIMIIIIELRGNLLFLSNSTSFVLSLAPYRLLYAFHFLSLGQKEEQRSHLFLSLQSSSDQKCIINLRQILLFWRPAGQLPSILKSHVSHLKQSYIKFAFAQSSIWNVTFPPSLWFTTAQYST